MAGAKRHRLEPWAYIKDVLMTLSAMLERVEDLLPNRWLETHPEHVLTHRLEESRDNARRRETGPSPQRQVTLPKAGCTAGPGMLRDWLYRELTRLTQFGLEEAGEVDW